MFLTSVGRIIILSYHSHPGCFRERTAQLSRRGVRPRLIFQESIEMTAPVYPDYFIYFKTAFLPERIMSSFGGSLM